MVNDSWPMKKLGEICEVFADGDWIETKDQSRNGIRLIQTGNVGRLSYIHKDGRARYISEQTFKRLGCTEVFPGDILISRLPDPVGRACIIPHLDTRMITSVDCTIIRPKINIVMREYLLYFTESPEYRSQIAMLLSGSTRKRISKSNLAEIKIPLPPLEIQKKIVKKIEELFAKISQAQSLRESATQDTNNLIPATLSKIFEEGKKKGWEEKRVEDVATKITKGTTPKTLGFQLTSTGVPFLRAENIDGEVNAQVVKLFMSEETSDVLERSKTQNGDVLITIAGTIGRVGWVPLGAPEMNMNQAVAIIRPKINVISTKYLVYVLRGRAMQDQVSAGTVKAAIPNFSLTMIRGMTIPLPPLAEQKEIVARMDALTQKVHELQTLQSQTASDLMVLKQSILHKAFQGEL